MLAEHVLATDGVVYGCVKTIDMDVIHKRLSTGMESCGSKYVQSFLGQSFREVCEDLMNGKKVLFVGVACQVAALKKYTSVFLTEEQCESLTTVDILCHGVPSRGVFYSYCKWLEKKHKSKIEDVIFRSKKCGYKSCIDGNRVRFVNGEEDSLNLFYKLYFDHIVLRPDCAKCPYKNLHRDADITLSDFWNIEQYLPEFLYPNGVSRVLINSQKGRLLFESIKADCTVCNTTIDSCYSVTQFNKAAQLSIEEHNKFYSIYKRTPDKAFVWFQNRVCWKNLRKKLLSLIKRW